VQALESERAGTGRHDAGAGSQDLAGCGQRLHRQPDREQTKRNAAAENGNWRFDGVGCWRQGLVDACDSIDILECAEVVK